LAVTRQKTKTTQSKRADLKRVRHEYGVLVQLSLASMAIRSFAVDLAQILAPARGGPTVTFARHAAMYLAVIEGRLSLTEAAAHFDRDRRAVAYGIARLEERRDADPAFDSAMDTLMRQFRQRLDDLKTYHWLTGSGDAA
jgi:chromosomal replication initiation ATPase DnaA